MLLQENDPNCITETDGVQANNERLEESAQHLQTTIVAKSLLKNKSITKFMNDRQQNQKLLQIFGSDGGDQTVLSQGNTMYRVTT